MLLCGLTERRTKSISRSMGKCTKFKELNIDRIEMGINLDKWVTEFVLCLKLIITFLFWIVHCPSHRFSRSTRDHTHFIFIFQLDSRYTLMLCVHVSSIINIQRHLIVLKRPFEFYSFGHCYLNSFLFSICHVIFRMRMRQPNAYTPTQLHYKRRHQNRDREKRKEDIIELDCCFAANVVLFLLFAVECYCFRVILCCRDIFDIESSMYKATVVYLYTISLIWLMTNAKNVRILRSECDSVNQFHSIDTKLSKWWEYNTFVHFNSFFLIYRKPKIQKIIFTGDPS